MTPSGDKKPPASRRIKVRLVLSLVAISVLPPLIAVLALLGSMPDAGEALGRAVVIALFLGGFCAFAAVKLADSILRPLYELRHGAEIISKINLSHRINLKSRDEFEELAGDFNLMAESLEGAYGELEERVRHVTLSLQDEKGRLATVLRTMVEGVIVVSEAGEVTLMNPRARMALAGGPELVVGTPLNRILPRGRVDYYLRKLRQSWEEGQDPILSVIFPIAGGKLLRGVMTAMPGQGGERSGFLLAFRDITEEAQRANLIETTLRALPSRLKSPLSSAQSLAEILQTRKTLAEDKREAFTGALRKEVEGCLGLVEEGEIAEARMPSSRWQGEPADPAAIVQDSLAALKGVYSHFNPPAVPMPPVATEPYGVISAICAVLGWLSSNSNGWTPIEASLEAEEEMVVATFRLAQTPGPNPDELGEIKIEEEGEEPVILVEAVRRNRGEIWTRVQEGSFEVRLGMMMASR
ncbi:HAMP domain-containing protein, partial [bacterium]